MPSLLEILKDPNYINANPATREAIFNRYAPQDENFAKANSATQDAIRQRFGLYGPLEEPPPTTPATPEAPAQRYQEVAETPLVSPEELLTAPPPAKSKSVMEGFIPPATGDTRMELPNLNTNQRRMYDAATPAQRKELIKKDPIFKQIDEAYRLRDEQAQADIANKSGIYKTAIDPFFFDTRAEHRKDALIKQGLDADLAETTARRMASSGIESKRNPFGEITESPPEYELAEGLKYDSRAKGIEQTAQVLKRAGTKAFIGLGQAGGGMNRFLGDMFGVDTSETVDWILWSGLVKQWELRLLNLWLL
jgi:hypothetical protein